MNDPTIDDPGGQVRPFAAVFTELAGGAPAAEAAEALQKLARNVTDLKRKGKVTITLEMGPRKGIENAVNVAVTVVLALPKPEAKEDVFYATADGVLTRSDPLQPELPGIREVPRPDHREARQV